MEFLDYYGTDALWHWDRSNRAPYPTASAWQLMVAAEAGHCVLESQIEGAVLAAHLDRGAQLENEMMEARQEFEDQMNARKGLLLHMSPTCSATNSDAPRKLTEAATDGHPLVTANDAFPLATQTDEVTTPIGTNKRQ